MPKRSGPERMIVVGALAGAHGVRGDVRLKSFTDDPETIFDLGPLMSDKGSILLESKHCRTGKDYFIVTPVEPRQKEDWDALKGTRLHVPRSALPPPDDDEFYVEDLVGLAALTMQKEPVGNVKSVQNFGAGDLLEIEPDDRSVKAFFVPFSAEDVPDVDFTAGSLTLRAADFWADQSDPGDEDRS